MEASESVEERIAEGLDAGEVDLADVVVLLVRGEVDDDMEEILGALRGRETVSAGVVTTLQREVGREEVAETKGIIENDDGSWTVELAEPVVWKRGKRAERTYTELKLQVPRGVHLLGMAGAKSGEERELLLLATQCGVHRSVIESLHYFDIERVRYVSEVMRGKPRPNTSQG